VAQKLAENEAMIVAELNAVQGQSADLGGYYRPDEHKSTGVMRPSQTFNAIVDAV